MTAYEYFTDNLEKHDRFIRTIIGNVVRAELERIMFQNRDSLKENDPLRIDLNLFLDETLQIELGEALNEPQGYSFDEIRFCDECGIPMETGYCLGCGDDYYCSDECLHKHYTANEFLAMYAGLDNTDPEEVALAAGMTQKELDELSDANDSQSYWTEWDWLKPYKPIKEVYDRFTAVLFLPERLKAKILEEVQRKLFYDGYRGDALEGAIQDALDSKLCDLEDTIDLKGLGL